MFVRLFTCAALAACLMLRPVGAEASSPDGGAALAPDGPRYKGALPYAEVLIDAGHGGIDGGTSYQDILEKNINLAVGKKLLVSLQKKGISAVLNRSGDYALSEENRWHPSRSRHKRDLSQRRQLTEEIHTGLLVSLHVNWSRRGAARGPVVLHQDRGESVLLALCIQDALNRQQSMNVMPRVGSPFYLLNTVKHPAVIVEMGFISHTGDREMLTSEEGQRQVAEAVASGLRQYKMLFR